MEGKREGLEASGGGAWGKVSGVGEGDALFIELAGGRWRFSAGNP